MRRDLERLKMVGIAIVGAGRCISKCLTCSYCVQDIQEDKDNHKSKGSQEAAMREDEDDEN
jgi:hypothetical protein